MRSRLAAALFLLACMPAACSFDLGRSSPPDVLDSAFGHLDRSTAESDRPHPGDRTGGDRPVDWAFDRSTFDKKKAEAKPFDAKGDLVPLLVSWQTKTLSSPATLSVGVPFYGGGASCTTGSLVKLLPHQQQKTFGAACEKTSSVETRVAVVGGLFKASLDSQPGLGGDVTCAGKIVGGGCECNPGDKLLASYPHVQNGWHCGCETAAVVQSYAICASAGAALVKDNDCISPAVLVGGGCNCGTKGILQSVPGAKGWICACDGVYDSSVGTRYSLCLTP